MNPRITVSLAVTLLLAAGWLGTSQAPDPGPIKQGGATEAAAHCDARTSHSSCLEYGDRSQAEADCASYEGTVASGPCPTEARSGTCNHAGKTRHYYTTGEASYDAGYAERHCRNTLAGEFKP
ncbi:MAG: hypothetical protein AB8H79_26255 [Myxococcota bacterium]